MHPSLVLTVLSTAAPHELYTMLGRFIEFFAIFEVQHVALDLVRFKKRISNNNNNDFSSKIVIFHSQKNTGNKIKHKNFAFGNIYNLTQRTLEKFDFHIKSLSLTFANTTEL